MKLAKDAGNDTGDVMIASSVNPWVLNLALVPDLALDQAPDGPALGAQAGPARLEAVLREAGFSRVRVAVDAANR